MRGIWVLGFMVLAACDGRDRPPGTRDGGGDGGVADSGADQDGGSFPDDPILDRTPDLQYTCTGALPVTRPPDRSWSGNGWTYGLTSTGSGPAIFGRVELEGEPFNPTSVGAYLSTLSPDGTFGANVEIPVASPMDVSSVAVGAIGDSVLFAYADTAGAMIARVTGTAVEGPTPLLSGGGTPHRIEIATKADRGAVIYGVRGADDRVRYLLQMIDATGAPVGQSYEVARAERAYLDPGASVVATEGGWAVAWRNTLTDDGEIYFRLFDEDGQPSGETKTVFADANAGGTVGFEGTSIALLAVDGGFLVGWVASDYGDQNDFTGAWAMVNLAKLDANGDPIGAPAPLMMPEIDFDHVEPELFHHGDAVGLAWSRGDHIYICAGCVPNHSLRMVLLDPERLIPVSEVAEIDDSSGGILYRSMLSDGTDVLAVFRIVYHVSSEGAFAAFHCEAN